MNLTWRTGPVPEDTGERYLLKRVDDKGDVWYDLDTFIPAEDGWNRVVAHIPLADILNLIQEAK